MTWGRNSAAACTPASPSLAVRTLLPMILSSIARLSATSKLRILVVDDDALVREVMSDELRRHGHEVAEHESGAPALAQLDRDPAWDLLVSDLSMPGMDGLALIRAARARRPGLHALLLTGYAGDGALYEALGAEDPALRGVVLVGKPVTGRMLAARVAEVLGPAPAPPAGR